MTPNYVIVSQTQTTIYKSNLPPKAWPQTIHPHTPQPRRPNFFFPPSFHPPFQKACTHPEHPAPHHTSHSIHNTQNPNAVRTTFRVMEGVSLMPEQRSQGSNRGSRARDRARRGGQQNPARRTTTDQVPAGEQARPGQVDGAPRGRGQQRGSASRGSGHHHRGRGNRASQIAVHGSRRQFGGQLTTTVSEQDSGPASPSTLNADASEFTPGQAHQPRQHGPPRTQAVAGNRPRRFSKSEAPDITTRTHEDIAHGVYECPICTSEIGRHSKIWSCTTCWTVFHLKCIKTWSKNEGSKSGQANDDPLIPRHWRCPGCNLPQEDMPSTYSCWCDKEMDPKSVSGIPPHSCGQTCGRPRFLPKVCPHPCELWCHAGPCPPCTRIGPTQLCFCGKQETTKRCSDTSYESGWSCGAICSDPMLCGDHTCPRPCHEGLCGACEVPIDSRCYCGNSTRSILCHEKRDEKISKVSTISLEGKIQVNKWMGIFDCHSECGREFDCGKHRCQAQCHPQQEVIPHCPRSPDVVTHCTCGKTLLSDISSQQRQNCEDPIPTCTEKCQKPLLCGHECQEICHAGQCGPCFQSDDINCRCGRTSIRAMCQQGAGEPPLCRRICKASMNCGRHECGDHCCSGERRASERTAAKRKFRTQSSHEEVEAEHICTRICGRLLKCGNHTCMELCHKGPCGTCREAIFDEISCPCGRTVLYPPLPCGAKPPYCQYPCEREKPCGHPQIQHNCHSDDQTCAKCPFLMEKPCMCGKKSLRNQPCFLQEVRCGEICGNKLRCGLHFCRKPCHRPGECEDAAGKACSQQCGKAKQCCGDPCEDICHGSSARCKEEKPCQTKIMITCDCQHLKSETKCMASKSSPGNTNKSLKCDDECARLQRNHNLALALNIDPATHTDEFIPYAQTTLNYYQESTKWAHEQERELRIFAADDAEKRLRFKPMPSHQRAFIHSLAEDFGFDSESMDPEPHRHVALFKTPRFVKAPMKTIAECIRIRARTIETASSAPIPSHALRRSNEPYNGFVLSSPRFGLTTDELRADLSSSLSAYPSLNFDISFLPNEEIVLKARSVTTSTPVTLIALKPTLKSTILAKELASSVSLCALDSSLNILRRETDPKSTESGWSTVAAKAASDPRSMPQKPAVGGKSSFTVLGSELKARKKREEEKKKETENAEVADDWEEEVRLEEEREKAQDTAAAPAPDTDNDGLA